MRASAVAGRSEKSVVHVSGGGVSALGRTAPSSMIGSSHCKSVPAGASALPVSDSVDVVKLASLEVSLLGVAPHAYSARRCMQAMDGVHKIRHELR